MKFIRWWKSLWRPLTYAEMTMRIGTVSHNQQVTQDEYIGSDSGTERSIDRIKGENK